jgi:hypothetical protein
VVTSTAASERAVSGGGCAGGALSRRAGGGERGVSSPDVTKSLSAEFSRRLFDCDVVRARPLRLSPNTELTHLLPSRAVEGTLKKNGFQLSSMDTF